MALRAVPILWLLSFIAALMPFEAYEAESFLISVLLLGGAVVCALAQRTENLPALSMGNAALLLTGFAFWGLALASAALSEIPYVSYIYFCFFSALPLTFILTLSAQRKEKFFGIVFMALGLVFAALAVFCFAQHFFMPGWLHKGFVHWPLADPNSLAGLFSVAFFCALSFMLLAPSRVHSNFGLVLCVLYTGAIFLTGSKGALIALLAALAVFIIFARAHVARHIRCTAALVISYIALFAALSFFAPDAAKSPMEAFQGADFVAHRAAIWGSTWDIIAEHFWTGTGIGTFFLYYPAYRGADYFSAGFMAHSDPLQFFAEMGVGGPALFYLFILIAGFLTFQKLRTLDKNDKDRVCILAPFCALGAMTAHSHINFHFNILPMLMASGLMLGMWHASMFKNAAKISVVPLDLLKPAVIIALAGGGLLFATLQMSEILTDRARAELMTGNLEKFSSDVNAASRLSGGRNARAVMLAAAVPLSILEGAENLSSDEKEKLTKQAHDLLDRAASLNPRLPGPLYDKARISKNQEEALREALKRDRTHIASRIMLADALIARGDKKEALAVLKEGMNWPNATPEYLQKTGFLALELDDAETHKAAMGKAFHPLARHMVKSGERELR